MRGEKGHHDPQRHREHHHHHHRHARPSWSLDTPIFEAAAVHPPSLPPLKGNGTRQPRSHVRGEREGEDAGVKGVVEKVGARVRSGEKALCV